jgi:hypothetical protein
MKPLKEESKGLMTLALSRIYCLTGALRSLLVHLTAYLAGSLAHPPNHALVA